MGVHSLSRLKSVDFLSNQLLKSKWRVVLVLSLTTLIFIFYTMPMDSVSPHHRPKTKLIFMNRNLCVSSAAKNNTQRTAVIVVLSSRKNSERRNLVRQTYGSVKSANNVQILAVVFLLANSDAHNNDVDRNKLQVESDRFGDIIMGDFVDSYRNLTLKTIMAYDWLTSHCREAQFVVKTDDDVVVNIFELTRRLDSLSPAEMVSSNIWCRVDQNESTVTNISSKFYASPVDFPNDKFPNHCSGLGYVTTFDVIERIMDDISKSFPARVCTHEDVFMTGVVVTHINSNPNSEPIKLVSLRHMFSIALETCREDDDQFLLNFVKNATMDTEIENCRSFRERNNKTIFFLITHNEEFEGVLRRLWQIIKKSFSN
ncbi:beta-1,3-galactosyltransferase 5-like [Bradysia coprophila]|uniref:beta-1,3-galactosyltransferase 5-like n=1 Tax=Bradysia coprophila TaxID=38358 RepID=UPI00187DD6AC|nr:beta-1,3-galactosyltransferase 5-like [Bradysia coprophila]